MRGGERGKSELGCVRSASSIDQFDLIGRFFKATGQSVTVYCQTQRLKWNIWSLSAYNGLAGASRGCLSLHLKIGGKKNVRPRALSMREGRGKGRELVSCHKRRDDEWVR